MLILDCELVISLLVSFNDNTGLMRSFFSGGNHKRRSTRRGMVMVFWFKKGSKSHSSVKTRKCKLISRNSEFYNYPDHNLPPVAWGPVHGTAIGSGVARTFMSAERRWSWAMRSTRRIILPTAKSSLTQCTILSQRHIRKRPQLSTSSSLPSRVNRKMVLQLVAFTHLAHQLRETWLQGCLGMFNSASC